MVAEALYDGGKTGRAANMRAILDELPESFAIKFSSVHREAPGERAPLSIEGCGPALGAAAI